MDNDVCFITILLAEPILLRGPVSFLIMCNNEHGPSFCRALILVVTASGNLPNNWIDYDDDEDSQGTCDDTEKSDDEDTEKSDDASR